MDTTQVLYNNSYGDGFEFSKAFLDEFAKRRGGKELDATKALFWKGKGSIRCDPLAIALFKEKGSEWSSGPTSSLQLREFSSVFENYWEIEEQDGDEYVRVLVAEALADVLHVFIQTGDKEALDRQYKAIMDANEKLTQAIYELPPVAAPAAAAAAEAELKKERVEVVTHVGHTYFDAELAIGSESKADSGHA